MTKYLLLLACAISIISCSKPTEEPQVICDPAAPSYEPVFIRLTDNMGANLLGTANYNVSNMEARQTCINDKSQVTLVKGLIDGNTDSTTFLRVTLAADFNGNTCNEFSIKWNNMDTETFTVDFEDSVVNYGDDNCKGYFYKQFINKDGNRLPRNNNMKTDNKHYANANGYSAYYSITK